MTADPVSYAVKLTEGGTEHRLLAEFRFVAEDIVNEHPIDLFGPVFRASLQQAAAAFSDPNVREVPIYRAGELEPVAYLTRCPGA